MIAASVCDHRPACYDGKLRTRPPQSNLGRAASPLLTQTIPLVTMESPKLPPYENCPFPFDYHHQNLIRQYKAPPQPSSPTVSRSTQPFCQDAECGPTDRQTDRPTDRARCVVVHCGNVAEALPTTGMLPNHCSSLRRIAV